MTTCTLCAEPAQPETGPLCGTCDDDLSHLYQLIEQGFRFCGCGDPSAAYNLLRDLLALCPYTEDDGWAKALALAGGSEPALYVCLYQLDAAGLIEHGSSIYASWFTPKGKHYLALMQQYGYRSTEDVGFPHDGDECPPDCRHFFAAR